MTQTRLGEEQGARYPRPGAAARLAGMIRAMRRLPPPRYADCPSLGLYSCWWYANQRLGYVLSFGLTRRFR